MFCSCKNTTPSDGAQKYKTKNEKRILLLGTGESGKTTIIKQMRILNLDGFSDNERKQIIPKIFQNVHESIFEIISNMKKIDPQEEFEQEENRESAEFILNYENQIPNVNVEYFQHVKRLWADKGVQATFQRSNEFQLIDSTAHFLNKIDEICQPDYIPTTEDILFCRITTTAISEIKFGVQVPKLGGGKANFVMIDVGGQRGHRKKWIQVFDGIEAILFLIAASDFDLKLREDITKNRLEEAFSLFGDMCASRFLLGAAFIVFLNKQDLLEKKIKDGKKIENYFPEYVEYRQNKRHQQVKKNKECNEYEMVRDFMQDKIKEIAIQNSQINQRNSVFDLYVENDNPKPKTTSNKDVFMHCTIATDTNNIKRVFKSVQEKILKTAIEETFSL